MEKQLNMQVPMYVTYLNYVNTDINQKSEDHLNVSLISLPSV